MGHKKENAYNCQQWVTGKCCIAGVDKYFPGNINLKIMLTILKNWCYNGIMIPKRLKPICQ